MLWMRTSQVRQDILGELQCFVYVVNHALFRYPLPCVHKDQKIV